MEFWGVEIKGEKPVKVQPDVGQVIHLSQATLGQVKKGGEPVTLSVKIGDKKLVIGILIPDNLPQLSFDLVFEKECELSHNYKNGSGHFLLICAIGDIVAAFVIVGHCCFLELFCLFLDSLFASITEDFTDYSEGEEDLQREVIENALVKAKPENAEKPKQNDKPKEDDDDSEEDGEDESSDKEDETDDEDMVATGEEDDGEEDGSDDDESSEDGEQPSKLAEPGKKRTGTLPQKTPEAKKAKIETPQRTEGKKGGHTATPHSTKNAGKTPSNGDKQKAQTPKSSSQVTCQMCKRNFNSEIALQSHTKAKHSAGK
ncbi:hypothetical protein Nepgr_013999 [Nepenthes gracilis]|uniref:C2H2-type domain-containing protein n=1 Tax=Nepenthes gracilis TaxID=150966 RepID=A0AAD3SJ47_NEPGR|nr:hypothetical protein Nepgr_013999 [Nepenthes gracilis]